MTGEEDTSVPKNTVKQKKKGSYGRKKKRKRKCSFTNVNTPKKQNLSNDREADVMAPHHNNHHHLPPLTAQK